MLAAKLNYPYLEMDAMFWKPNWRRKWDTHHSERRVADNSSTASQPCHRRARYWLPL
ncbi:hypothetical protein [Aeromonas schubertii]|uniref:hypothetical protein n=1 Tax=Aeromonas schubertii TaxID=652 RepID=UPI002FFB7351